MKNKVVATKYTVLQYPFTNTAVAYLLLDKFNASGWIWGFVGTIYAILWITVILRAFNCEFLEPRWKE